jgi:hypothetical protein
MQEPDGMPYRLPNGATGRLANVERLGTAAQQARPIHDAYSNLSLDIERAEKALFVLEDRLAHVLRPIGPEAAAPNRSQEAIFSGDSPMVHSIREDDHRINTLIGRLEGITDRLEI